MNARQKAKLYKKRLETIQDMLNPKIPQIISGNISTIETISVSKIWDERIPIEFIKKDVAHRLAELLLDCNFIYYKVDYNCDSFKMCKSVKGYIKVCKDWWKEM